ncbi:MAG: hypothetical protein ETSY2_08600 [Candidatus Entotheonella gemina]|uniref:HNH domain-containing protein n=1 Tax=Candidatus Entotheonella gemina TaxID=1429439 RepID=W4ME39_9BACT|nr:MAG: hypothetical protein ETSY2_08600 [Candidatus Entotheonella gemina]
MTREQWFIKEGIFQTDHFVPQSISPEDRLNYDNLLYACVRCNEAKKNLLVPDPCEVAIHAYLHVDADGVIYAAHSNAERLIEILRLNSRSLVRYRRQIIKTMRLLENHNHALFVEWMKYPDDLPDLARLRPPFGNTRPTGIWQSYFAQREHGELPETY